MRIALPLFFVVFLFGCEEQRETKARISVFSTGRSHSDESNSIIKSYGSHAIRIDDGTAQIRIYKVARGKKVLEEKFVLNSLKHPMAWVTPSIRNGEAQFEFGMEEHTVSRITTPHYYTTFSKAESVGSALTRRVGAVSDTEEPLVIYYVKLDGAVLIPVVVTDTILGITKFSEHKDVEFYLVTAASE